MAPIATYVFLDLETTGLPSEECNKTKITELSMVAVKREHLLATRPGIAPRVLQKLTLCLNPCKLIADGCSQVTGLDNFLLEHEPIFDLKVFTMINTFLQVLTKPVCLIAQNGLNFDFPILKRQLDKLKQEFSEDILCADCYHAFYDILEAKKSSPVVGLTNSTTSDEKSVDEVDLFSQENTLSMQAINESTPKQKPQPNCKAPRVGKARRRIPWSESSKKPTESYKLKDIYERVLNHPAIDAHRAENDCIMACEISVALSKDFVQWVDDNHCPFTDIKPMTIGVRLGD